MRHSTERGLVVALVLLTATYAVAEEIILTTYYPSPRGVYEDLRAMGTLGVGTMTPESRLQVEAPDSGLGSVAHIVPTFEQLSVLTTDAQGADRGAVLGLGGRSDAAGTVTRVFGAIAGKKENATAGDDNGYLSFHTGVGGFGVMLERMRISSTGNVGIGTTNPVARLTVAGAAPGPNPVVTISTPGTVGFEQAVLQLATRDANANGALNIGDQGWHIVGRGNAWVTLEERNDLIFYRWDGADFIGPVLDLDASGNVGIGTTAPAAKLDIQGTIIARNGYTQPGTNGETLKMIRGVVSTFSTIFEGSGFTVDRVAGAPVGKYNITFTTPFSSPPVVVTNTYEGGGPIGVCGVTPVLSDRVEVWCHANPGGGLQDNQFGFIALGPP